MKAENIQIKIKEYLKIIEKSKLAKISIKNYRSDIKRFEQWIVKNRMTESNNRLEELINRYLWELKQSKKIQTFKRNKSTLNKLYAWICENKLPEEKGNLNYINYNNKIEYKPVIALVTLLFIFSTVYPLVGMRNPTLWKGETPEVNNGSETVNLNSLKASKANNDSWFLGPIEINEKNIKQVTLILDNNMGQLTETNDTTEDNEVMFKLAANNPVKIYGEEDNESEDEIELMNNNNNNKGVGIIPAGSTGIKIVNKGVTPFSIITLTATSPTNNQVLFIKEQTEGSFTVALENKTGSDISFYWVID